MSANPVQLPPCYDVSAYGAGSSVFIPNFEHFLELVRSRSPSVLFHAWTVFKVDDKNLRDGEFLFFSDGLAYRTYGEGYKSIPDLLAARGAGFKGMQKTKLLQPLLGSIWERMGVNSYDGDGRAVTEGDVYYYVTALGYSNVPEYTEAASAGFVNDSASDFRSFKASGFPDAESFRKARTMGVADPRLFADLQATGLDLPGYRDLELLRSLQSELKVETLQEAHLFVVLNGEGKTKGAADILAKMRAPRSMRDSYGRSRYESSLPDWYTARFPQLSPTSLGTLLESHPVFRELGTYDPSREVFEHFSDETVLIDGGNVAWNNGSKDAGDKPHAKNIHIVAEELRQRGFTKILAITDAATFRYVADPEEYKELQKDGIVKQSPAKAEADEFILHYVKEFKARVISNDQYRDWQEKDEWARDNIGKFRCGFMIIDDKLKLQDENAPVVSGSFARREFPGFHFFSSSSDQHSVGKREFYS